MDKKYISFQFSEIKLWDLAHYTDDIIVDGDEGKLHFMMVEIEPMEVEVESEVAA